MKPGKNTLSTPRSEVSPAFTKALFCTFFGWFFSPAILFHAPKQVSRPLPTPDTRMFSGPQEEQTRPQPHRAKLNATSNVREATPFSSPPTSAGIINKHDGAYHSPGIGTIRSAHRTSSRGETIMHDSRMLDINEIFIAVVANSITLHSRKIKPARCTKPASFYRQAGVCRAVAAFCRLACPSMFHRVLLMSRAPGRAFDRQFKNQKCQNTCWQPHEKSWDYCHRRPSGLSQPKAVSRACPAS